MPVHEVFVHHFRLPQMCIRDRDGAYAAWDRTNLSDLRFDTTVTAVYTPYTPGLASDAVREDGRAVFLTEGDYTCLLYTSRCV